ncbi:MAG TPA: cobalt ECF transporter T component CbiQ [Candidatus Methanoculleus thermohydrogenotrophicum]|jgi:cobalt/nickel transport system permease protein|nr:cobalt ECF transporter T component CbiQ [Candidatus Methanoculleus thermohydrogenotrophicum]HOB17675.1 cobalt ECF transporter T component CbiQ [Candidatus Methanoculleus thermohydrogenotrophicum]HPZ37303.1 cobalt ECF transporter T component CbiQ [Candidatus Methanoculleus thermohydrogenotrophicum]HQC91179.1 cobalt ECF transporter T component CbiQ [Candidatus Methanoculleus thermohydrogenotrophicum]
MLEDFAQTNDLRETSPGLKLFLGLASILLCVSSPGPVAPLLVAASMSAAILLLARIPPRVYARLLLIPVSFAVMSIVVILFVTGSGTVLLKVPGLPLAVTADGVNLAILLLARVFGGMCSLFFIALTTPMTEVFDILRRLGVPSVLIDLAMLIYRFIFILIEEAGQIYRAQVMRLGYGRFRESVNSFGMLAGALFLRTWESGEALVLAMDARCYDGKLGIPGEARPLSPLSLVAVLVYLGTVLGVSLKTGDLLLI